MAIPLNFFNFRIHIEPSFQQKLNLVFTKLVRKHPSHKRKYVSGNVDISRAPSVTLNSNNNVAKIEVFFYLKSKVTAKPIPTSLNSQNIKLAFQEGQKH